jgi:predicted 3-demethylubiquinone-9 3-methyltransferase (glyoxalase superfamily)
MQKITPFLWFDGKAEAAMKFYVSIFKKSKILAIDYWGKGTPFPAKQVKAGRFQLEGQTFYCMDAGPHAEFTMALSLFVDCKTQAEVDHYYDTLSKGGEKQPCGWVKDKFGVSWQIVPDILSTIVMHSKDPEKGARAMQAMMQMHKLDIAKLKKAYEGK